ncbi:MAG: bifunctional DNA-formamidopyrimidine glycosylase/DNA-(apurinic or apyrimidinic site) lyase [Candidatus Omnitrophica bacterium]|nr:bifunctional DNA-formamidopyrimidine glycosylase/DNA-(apurinic or apyrimidinic site) lyase [Candidatus Omnitrophota bacterium]MDO9572473.1 bifunctional DNA-formamidopyrimidine glycosylase/DNA-(apurinic or apyrimidinic site) lyase [Candidatus Omnitrophota bacterium]
MPELPEVETIKQDLQKIITGKKIIKVCVHNPKVIREPALKAFKKSLEDVTIKRILRRAKLLIFELSNSLFLTVHLKMTGQLVLRQKLSTNPELVEGLVYPGGAKNSRVAFHLAGGDILDFNDQRLFGELRVVGDWKKLKFVQSLGPEPFDLTYFDFRNMLSKKKTKIKPLLMDQGFISGIGNLYAAEILFGAKINPERSAQGLTEAEKARLYKEMQGVLTSAIKHGGSSVDDYVRLSGKRGDYARFHQVYGRINEPCFVCKTLIQRIAQGGRGTYFCPQCQR